MHVRRTIIATVSFLALSSFASAQTSVGADASVGADVGVGVSVGGTGPSLGLSGSGGASTTGTVSTDPDTSGSTDSGGSTSASTALGIEPDSTSGTTNQSATSATSNPSTGSIGNGVAGDSKQDPITQFLNETFGFLSNNDDQPGPSRAEVEARYSAMSEDEKAAIRAKCSGGYSTNKLSNLEFCEMIMQM